LKLHWAFSCEVTTPVFGNVNLVEDEKIERRQFSLQNSFAVLGDIPVQIAVLVGQKFPGQRGLADLPGTADKDYFSLQIVRRISVPVDIHADPAYYRRVDAE